MHENGWFSKIYGEMELMSSKGMQINLGGEFQGLMTGTKIISSHYKTLHPTQRHNQLAGANNSLGFQHCLNTKGLFEKINSSCHHDKDDRAPPEFENACKLRQ